MYHGRQLCYNFVAFTKSIPKIISRLIGFSEADPSSLDLSLEVAYKENASAKLGNFFKHGKLHDKTNDAYFLPKLAIPKHQIEFQEFNMDISDPKGLHYNLFMKWRLETKYNKEVAFKFMKDQFKNYHIQDIMNDCNAFDLKNLNLSGPRGECIGAQHQVVINSNSKLIDVYKCEVLHIPSIQWSSIRILSQNEMDMMTTSNLIGLAQLPLKSQMQDPNYLLDLDPKFEKAMLIKNIYGDFAIVKGKWVGFRRGVAPRNRGQRGIPGDPGHLQVIVYFFDSKSFQKIDVPASFKFEIRTMMATAVVDLQTGKLNVRANDGQNLRSNEVENLVATVLSISTIHVLLQPKQNPCVRVGNKLQIAPRPATTAVPVRGGRPVRSVIMDDYLLFSMIGYNELVASPCFMNYYEWQTNNPDVVINECSTFQPSDDQNNFCDNNDMNNNNCDNMTSGGDQWMFNDCDGVTNNDHSDIGGGADLSGIDNAGGCGGKFI